MPTDARIEQLTCRYADEQDPVVWDCHATFQPVLGGDLIEYTATQNLEDTTEDFLGAAETALEITVV